jgi:hypothetical protein
MTAFQRTTICIAIIIGFFGFFKWRTPDMTIVYPDNCVFVIDGLFSRAMQLEIKNFIDAGYKKNKNPSNLLPKIESTFPAIKSVIIDMSSLASSCAKASADMQEKGTRGSFEGLVKEDYSKALKFSIQAYHPEFLINNEHVICQYGKMFAKDIFAQEELVKLENISFDGVPTPKNVDRLTRFFETLVKSQFIFKDFSVRWIDKHAIWLDQKQGLGQAQDLSLLVGYDTVPTSSDVKECRHLRGQIIDKPCKDKRGRPCKNNTTWVCDLRFNQQIVLFSTNKGV